MKPFLHAIPGIVLVLAYLWAVACGNARLPEGWFDYDGFKWWSIPLAASEFAGLCLTVTAAGVWYDKHHK